MHLEGGWKICTWASEWCHLLAAFTHISFHNFTASYEIDSWDYFWEFAFALPSKHLRKECVLDFSKEALEKSAFLRLRTPPSSHFLGVSSRETLFFHPIEYKVLTFSLHLSPGQYFRDTIIHLLHFHILKDIRTYISALSDFFIDLLKVWKMSEAKINV